MGQLRECCCFSLRTGAAVIGVLYLIGSTISLAGLVIALINLFSPYYVAMRDHEAEFYDLAFDPELQITFQVICIVLAGLSCLQFVVDILLMVAGLERKASLAAPWLIANMVVLVFFLACMIALSIVGFFFKTPFVNIVSIAPLVVGFIYLAVTVFAMMIVSAYYETGKYYEVKQHITPFDDYMQYKK